MKWGLSRFLVLGLVMGCPESNPPEGLPDGGTSDGGGDAGATKPADLAKGKDHLRGGDLVQALDDFGNVDQPEAAFGRCFARTFAAVGRPEVSAVLQRFGDPPFAPADFAGARSLPSRYSAVWAGSAALNLLGPFTQELRMPRARRRPSSVEASDPATQKTLYIDGPMIVGSFPLRYSCPDSEPASPEWYLSLEIEGHSCGLPAFGAIVCEEDGGKIELLTDTADESTLRLTNVLLECNCTDGPCSSRLSGDITANARPVNLTGVHPLLKGAIEGSIKGAEYFSRLGAGTTLGAVVGDLEPLGAELRTAARDCEAAGEGEGVVFRIPGEVFGTSEIAVTAGDATFAAAALEAFAFGLDFVASYDQPFLLSTLCSGQDCISDEQLVGALNAGTPRLTDPTKVKALAAKLTRPLDLAERAMVQLGPSSLVPYEAELMAMLKRWAHAFKDSIANGAIAIPDVSPPISLDLKKFFATPKDPSAATADPFVWNADLGHIEAVEMFFEDVLGYAIDVAWDGKTNYKVTREFNDGTSETLEKVGLILHD